MNASPNNSKPSLQGQQTQLLPASAQYGGDINRVGNGGYAYSPNQNLNGQPLSRMPQQPVLLQQRPATAYGQVGQHDGQIPRQQQAYYQQYPPQPLNYLAQDIYNPNQPPPPPPQQQQQQQQQATPGLVLPQQPQQPHDYSQLSAQQYGIPQRQPQPPLGGGVQQQQPQQPGVVGAIPTNYQNSEYSANPAQRQPQWEGAYDPQQQQQQQNHHLQQQHPQLPQQPLQQLSPEYDDGKVGKQSKKTGRKPRSQKSLDSGANSSSSNSSLPRTSPGSASSPNLSETKTVTKRSRLGCLTCRHRKKRCCETKPRCTECSRLRLNCTWPKPGTEHKNKPKDQKEDENTIEHEIYGRIKVLRGIVEYRSK